MGIILSIFGIIKENTEKTKSLKKVLKNIFGAVNVEYVLIICLVAVVAAGGLATWGRSMANALKHRADIFTTGDAGYTNPFGEGMGTPGDPWHITTVSQWNIVASNSFYYNKSFILAQNIDANGKTLQPWSYAGSVKFIGRLDNPQKYSISNAVLSPKKIEDNGYAFGVNGENVALSFNNCTFLAPPGYSSVIWTISGIDINVNSGTSFSLWNNTAVLGDLGNAALFDSADYFSVTYNTNGATNGGATPTTQSAAKKYTVASGQASTKLGIGFSFWNTEPDGTGLTYYAGDSITPLDDTTLYAQYGATKVGFHNGTGTITDPYIITTPAEWNYAATFTGGGLHFALGNDIYAQGSHLLRWGWVYNSASTLDGQGYTIDNALLSMTAQSDNYLSLVDGAAGTVKNLSVTNCSFNGVLANGTGVVTSPFGDIGTITNVSVTSCSISSTRWAYGFSSSIRSYANRCSATNNTINVTISYSDGTGTGFTGTCSGIIVNCFCSGETINAYNACGFINSYTSSSTSIIKNCYSANTLAGTLKYGWAKSSSATYATTCFWDTTIGGAITSTGATALTTSNMKSTTGSIAALNTDVGAGVWTLSSGQYPSFAPDNGTTPLPVATYSVTYNAHGGTGTAPPTQNGATSYVAPANTFSYSGFTFNNWNTAADGSGISFTPGQTLTPTSNWTLYAQWNVKTYSVTYNLNGVSGTCPATQTGSQSYVTPLKPVTGGFSGWNTNTQGTGTYYGFGATITPSANMTLYLQFSISP